MHRDPDWYDGTRDYSAPEYAVCADLGAVFKDSAWEEVERHVLALFSEFGAHLKWKDARSAIYFAWKEAQEPTVF